MTKINSWSNYWKLTADNKEEYAAMKEVKLTSHGRIKFDDENMTAEVQSRKNCEEFERIVARTYIPATVEKTVKATVKNNRLAVEAGTVSVGDIVNGRKVTGLGKRFSPYNDDFYSVNGVNPGADFVQYAYFN